MEKKIVMQNCGDVMTRFLTAQSIKSVMNLSPNTPIRFYTQFYTRIQGGRKKIYSNKKLMANNMIVKISNLYSGVVYLHKIYSI